MHAIYSGHWTIDKMENSTALCRLVVRGNSKKVQCVYIASSPGSPPPFFSVHAEGKGGGEPADEAIVYTSPHSSPDNHGSIAFHSYYGILLLC